MPRAAVRPTSRSIFQVRRAASREEGCRALSRHSKPKGNPSNSRSHPGLHCHIATMPLVCELFGVIGVGEASSLSSLLTVKPSHCQASSSPIIPCSFIDLFSLFVQRQLHDSIITARLYRRRNIPYSRCVFERRMNGNETRSITSMVR